MSETFYIHLPNILFSMSELNKELIQFSLFIYFNRFFAKTLLHRWPKYNFFFPRKSSFILLLLIRPIPFCMQKIFNLAIVSAMNFSIFLLSFLTIIKVNARFVDGAFAATFSRFFSVQQLHIIGQNICSNMNDQITVFIFNKVIRSTILSLVPLGKLATFTLWALLIPFSEIPFSIESRGHCNFFLLMGLWRSFLFCCMWHRTILQDTFLLRALKAHSFSLLEWSSSSFPNFLSGEFDVMPFL